MKEANTTWPYPIQYGEETEVEADVLILGGGVAGCHSAINAAKRGAKVVLVEKGAVVRSGCGGAGVDHWHLACTNPSSKIAPQEMIEEVDYAFGGGDLGYGEYGNGITCYIQCKESYEALLDVEKMGVSVRDDRDEFVGAEFRDDESKLMFAYDYENKNCVRIKGADIKPALYKEVKKQGVTIIDSVMATRLLTEGGNTGGRVVGATGLHVRTGAFYIFKAKATIVTMGNPNGLWIYSTELNGSASSFWDPNNVGDGAAMAYQAGAELTMMDDLSKGFAAGGFMYPPYGTGNAHNTWYACTIVDADGKEIPWVNRDGRPLQHISERYRPAKDQKLTLGVPFATYHIQTAQLIPDLPERIRKGEFKLPLYADLPSMPEHERRAIFGLHVGHEGKTRVPVYLNYTKNGFDPDKDMLQVNMMPSGQYDHSPWWLGMTPRHWFTLGRAGMVFDWKLQASIPGLFGAGMQLSFSGDHAGASATGRYAGRNATEFVRNAQEPEISREQVEKEKLRVYAPIERADGIGWKELRAGICRIMQDYCGEHRTEEVLNKGLEWLDSIQESEAANAYARNSHELMRTLECQTPITVGKLVMNACSAAEKVDKASEGGLKQVIMGLVMRLQSLKKKGTRISPEVMNMYQRGHYITVRQEDGEVKTGKLPFKYWLKPPYAPTYEENYQKHCAR